MVYCAAIMLTAGDLRAISCARAYHLAMGLAVLSAPWAEDVTQVRRMVAHLDRAPFRDGRGHNVPHPLFKVNAPAGHWDESTLVGPDLQLGPDFLQT